MPRAGVETVVECDELTLLLTVATKKVGEFVPPKTTAALGDDELVVAVCEIVELADELIKDGVDELLPDVSVVGKVDLTVAANEELLF